MQILSPRVKNTLKGAGRKGRWIGDRKEVQEESSKEEELKSEAVLVVGQGIVALELGVGKVKGAI